MAAKRKPVLYAFSRRDILKFYVAVRNGKYVRRNKEKAAFEELIFAAQAAGLIGEE